MIARQVASASITALLAALAIAQAPVTIGQQSRCWLAGEGYSPGAIPLPSRQWRDDLRSRFYLPSYIRQFGGMSAWRSSVAPVKIGPVIYSVILFTALINWLIWGQSPTLLDLAGMTLVIIGGIIAVVQPSQPIAPA